MNGILNYLLVALLIWVIIFFFLEITIIMERKNKFQHAYNDINKEFFNKIDLVLKGIEIIKKYASLDAMSLEKSLNYLDEKHNPDYVFKMKDLEKLKVIISKIDLLTVAFEELNNDKEFVELKNELLSYKDNVDEDINNYNTLIDSYNVKRKMFPTAIVAFCLNLRKCDNYLYKENN